MLRAADIEIDGQPLLQKLGIGERIVVQRIDVAQIVPARTGPLRHSVSLADALLARDGIDDVEPLRRLCERRFARAGRLVVLKDGERERKILFVHERLGAILPVDHRERFAPIALTGEKPVAEFVLHLGLAAALLLEPCNHLRLGILDAETRDETRIDHHAIGDVGIGGIRRVRHTLFWARGSGNVLVARRTLL